MSRDIGKRCAALAAVLVFVCVGVWRVAAGTVEIGFPGYGVTGTLTNFPALVVLSEKPGGFSYDGFLSPQGYDLRFSNATGTAELDYEIESWNPGGLSYVWVRIPEFASNTVVRASWGGASAEQPASSTNGAVWAEPCRGIWHLTPGLKDSTAYANDGDPSGTTADRNGPVGHARQTGQGQSIALSGTSEQLAVSDRFTFSFWARTTLPATAQSYLYVLQPAGGGGQTAVICGYTASTIEFYASGFTGDNPRPGSSMAVPDSDWHQYVYTYDGAVWSGYRDGAQVFSVNRAFSLNQTPGGKVARIGSSTLGNYFAGGIDEFRVEAAARSAEWIRAAYLNQREGMTRKAPIRFAEYDRGETLTNFPALVVLNERLPGFSYDTFRSAQGVDLRFSDDAEAESLDYEVETWNPQGNSYVWVRVPAFSSNCTIRAAWGDPAMTNLPASCTNGAVWAEPFRGVWHLGELNDSTRYGNAGTGSATALLRGPVGACARRTGPDASILLGGSSEQLAVSNAFTFSFWARTALPAASQMYLYQLAPASGGQQTGLLCGYVANTVEFFAAGNTGSSPRTGSQILIPDDGWHHYAYTYDGATWIGCRDGSTVFRTAAVFSLAPKAGTNRVVIGSAYNQNWFRGGLDEFRVEASPRSTNWLYACYRNQQVRREGCDYLGYPVFGERGTVTDVGPHSARVGAYLSCRFPVEGRLYYGTSDGGEVPDGWEVSQALGRLYAGAVSTNIAGLLPDRNYACRFWASNDTGVAWSPPLTFRSAPDPAAYSYRMRIRLTGYTGQETLTNFPVLVRLNEEIAGFSYRLFASESGRDLRFTDESGAPLNYEVETWDTNGDSYVWIQIPELRQGGTVWAFLKNRAALDLPAYCSNGGAWSSGFCGVYHLTPALRDATFAANHVTADTGTSGTNGPVSEARAFAAGPSLQLGASGSLGVSDCFTFSFWARTPYPCESGMYIYNRSPAGQSGYQHGLICGYTTNQVEFHAAGYAGTNPRSGSALPIPDDGWHHYAYAYDGWNWCGYCDGERIFAAPRLFSLAFTDAFGANAGRIGCDVPLARPFTGALDELRVEKAYRSAEWIRACYANQLSADTFAVCEKVVNLRGTLVTVR
jgi:sarcosine oxidase delta subunit